jgi:hypothetical protein
LNRVEARILALGNDALIDRWDDMQITFKNEWASGGPADANYGAQVITFYKAINLFDGNPAELDFVVAHEFAHLTPENRATVPEDLGEALTEPQPTQRELNADAQARWILGIPVNPLYFRDMSHRQF